MRRLKSYIFIGRLDYRIVVALVGVVGILASVWWKGNATHQIVYQNGEFYPASLVVKVGERVTFVNKDKRPIWPASNPHPFHTNYAQFDPKESIEAGGSWTMSFEEAGTWQYHNHLGSSYSQDTGVVIVLRPDQSVEDVVEDISRSSCLEQEEGPRLSCWKTRLVMLVKARGIDFALHELKELYEIDPFVAQSCNNLTHAIGGAAVEIYKKSKSRVWIPETLYCGGGFYHGFMEVYLNQYKRASQAVKLCEEVGRSMGVQSHASVLACFHGLGHGFAEMVGIHTVYDWEKIAPHVLRESALLCRTHALDRDAQDSCLNGVFVSFQMHYVASVADAFSYNSDFFWMCRAVTAQDGALFCYAAMTMHLFETDNDIRITMKKVLNMVPREYQQDVMFSLMHTYLFSQAKQKEYEVYIRLCRSLPAYVSQDACVQAIAGGLFNNGTPTKEFVAATEFCASPYLTQREKSICFQEALQLVKQVYGLEVWTQACNTVDEQYKAYCVPE